MIRFTAAALGVALLALSPAGASPTSNKMLVERLYAKVFNEHDLAAADQLLTPEYIQHHPGLASGRPAFVKAFAGYFAAVPTVKVVIKRVIAEGDLVVVHALWKDSPTDPGSAVVDIYRIQGSRIAEHWDVIQPIPTTISNPDTLF